VRSGFGVSAGGNYSFLTYLYPDYRSTPKTLARAGYDADLTYLLQPAKNWLITVGLDYVVMRYQDVPPNNVLMYDMVAYAYYQQNSYVTQFVNLACYLNRSFGTGRLKLRTGLGVEPALQFNNHLQTDGWNPQGNYDYTKSWFLFAGAKVSADIRLCKSVYLVVEERLKISGNQYGGGQNPVFYKGIGLNCGVHIFPGGK
ncbi:MAG TPA: hypothetical protein VNZ86_00975, partial [Bacteroidia bacterium]|nr:hypothetical protein [Bacteroidia bacterium]